MFLKMQYFLLRPTIIIICILLIGCAKNKDEPEPTPQPSQGSFTWQPTPGPGVTADSAHYYHAFTTIYAFKNGNLNSLAITLYPLTVGTYTFSSISGNELKFTKDSKTYNAVSGSCNITEAANNKLSGNFYVNFSGGAITALSGNFTDIPGR